jgi:hypothetical protein
MKDPKIFKDFVNNKYSEEEIREFVKKYPKKIDYTFWWRISIHQDLSESFIREFKDQVDWWSISKYQDLSEPFIRDFKDQVNWWCISRFQDLSEDFIREFKDKVDWWDISAFQDLSEEFLIEFINYIETGNKNSWGLEDNENIPEDVKKRIIDLKKLLESA